MASRRAGSRLPDNSQGAEASASSRRVSNNIPASRSQAAVRQLTRAGRRPDDDGEADDEDLDAQIEDMMAPLPKAQVDDQYLKNPLERETANAKLKSLTQEWEICFKRMQTNLDMLGNVIVDVQEAKYNANIDGDLTGEDDPVVAAADRDFRSMLDAMAEAASRKQALLELKQRIQLNDPVTNALSAYEKRVDKDVRQYGQKTTRQKYLRNQGYTQYRDLLWEATGLSGPKPNLKTVIAREEGDEESEDEDVEIADSRISMKDPITLTWLENPVKHPACKHIYSRDSILAYIGSGSNKTSIQCPVSGCNKTVHEDQLEEYPQMARRVQAQRRREEQNRRPHAEAVTDDLEEDDE